MNVNCCMEGKKNTIPKLKIEETKSKIFPKLRESPNAKKVKGFLFKSSSRHLAKKLDDNASRNKNRLQTNIPLSDPLMRTRSYEMEFKTENTSKKLLGKDEKNKFPRSKSASEDQKTSSKDKEPMFGVNMKVGEVSKGIESEKELKNEPLTRSTIDEKSHGKGFTNLLPFCERELKRIEDAWLNTIYCCLSMRTNLVQFLIHSFPNVDRSQFHTEDKKLFQCFDQVKASTKAEIGNLLNLARSLLVARSKVRDEYQSIIKNDDKEPRKKAEDGGQHVPESSEKKASENEKSQNTEISKKKKNLSLLTFYSFGNKQSNNSFRKQTEKISKVNISSNAEESNENKPEATNLITVQKDFDALKTKYSFENETYKKKIKDLEYLLEEKIKVLKREKEVKNQLLTFLSQFQAQQRRLGRTIGYDQLEYFIGQSTDCREKRREEIWLPAVKLILKGFFTQLKNLEKERNKMLLQLRSNDIENFNASIIQKDNFVKSIKQQMIFQNGTSEKNQ